MSKAVKKKKPKKKKLTRDEKKQKKEKRKFLEAINTIFNNSGFTQVATRDKRINLSGRDGEIDNVFVYENVIVLVEDTMTSGQRELKDHIMKTVSYYQHIEACKAEFIDWLDKNFNNFDLSSSDYDMDEFQFKFIYCSRNRVEDRYIQRFPSMEFLNYSYLQYFLKLAKTIKKSTKYELFKFLRLTTGDIGHLPTGSQSREYEGFLLPTSASGFPRGYKVVSFLIDPKSLIEQGYVLRKDGWMDSDCLYQRLLIKNKIDNMRKYLTDEKRVFINNIIVTLPDTTKINPATRQPTSSNEKIRVHLRLNYEFNSIGIIDGQHRVFSYHEGFDKAESYIRKLRDKQHLLISGIIYPPGVSDREKKRFEAMLFLEINDKQSRTKGDLKQAIATIVHPFSQTAIAKRVITGLSKNGPLTGHLEEYFFDKGKIKTTSIVSYGLRHIVGIDSEHSFFKIWKNRDKKKIKTDRDKDVLNIYVKYCVSRINEFLSAFKENIDESLWVLDKKVSAVLRTTTINGLIFCIRRLIENKKISDFNTYNKHLKKLHVYFTPSEFPYKSSHWKALGELIYDQCFS